MRSNIMTQIKKEIKELLVADRLGRESTLYAFDQ